MRGDGEVDSDGWEYNASFRSQEWRAQVKSLNRGGWVRRRRWVRLMMSPSYLENEPPEQLVDEPKLDSTMSREVSDVWKGDDGDWLRCSQVMKQCGRDGRKYELWKSWLITRKADEIVEQEGGSRIKTQDSYNGQWQVQRLEWIGTVLREHGRDIFWSFVYPETRARFLSLLEHGHLQANIDSELLDSVRSEFWSYRATAT